MDKCYLCGEEANIRGKEYGLRKIVNCPECKIYEIGESALKILEDPEFNNERRFEVQKTIININKSKNNAEIVFNGKILSARTKSSKYE